MENKKWINKTLYPFETKKVMIDGLAMSYVDEGANNSGRDPIVFIHGIPGWSFEFRNIISGLTNTRRCIAPDHIGFGLSDKPDPTTGIDYTPAGHALRLGKFIEQMNIKKFQLVVHDFGGPIGLAAAMEMQKKEFPGKISRLVIMNSWLWALNEYDHFVKPSKIIRTGMGKFLYEKMNFSANVLLKTAFADRKHLTREIHRHYKNAQNGAARKATYQLARALIDSGDWYNELWKNRSVLKNIPTTIVWGMQDSLLPAKLLLEKWRTGFPHANVVEIQNAGHFPHEEKPEEVIRILNT